MSYTLPRFNINRHSIVPNEAKYVVYTNHNAFKLFQLPYISVIIIHLTFKTKNTKVEKNRAMAEANYKLISDIPRIARTYFETAYLSGLCMHS